MSAKATRDGAETRTVTTIETDADAIQYQGKHWREDVAILDGELDSSMNFVEAGVYSSRHGTEGYYAHFTGPYLFERATKAIHELGFEIVSMQMHSHNDDAEFLVIVRRTRPAMSQDLGRIDDDHYLIKSDTEEGA